MPYSWICTKIWRGESIFSKNFFPGHFPRRIHLTPPSRIFYNYQIFNILQLFYHLLPFLIRAKTPPRTMVSPECAPPRASAPLPTRNTPAHYPGGAMSAATARGGSSPSRLAPYRHYTRKIRTRITPVSRCRAHHSCGLAVGRDVPIAPPRHRRGARLGIPRPRRAAWSRAPWCGMAVRPVSGALGVTRRRALRGYRGRTETPPAKLSACATCHTPCPCPVAIERDARPPGLPTRAAAPRGAVPLR